MKGEYSLMNYDTINLLGLQPDDIQELIIISITLIKKLKPALFVWVFILK